MVRCPHPEQQGYEDELLLIWDEWLWLEHEYEQKPEPAMAQRISELQQYFCFLGDVRDHFYPSLRDQPD
jgi:hypothetical protein